jgi:TatD DNase family protein
VHGVDRSLTEAALIDTHCHLVLLDERGLLAQALEGAYAAGVETIITIGVNLEDSDRNRAIAEAHSGVFFTVGWDPQQKAPPDPAEQRALGELLQHPCAVAVGEVGLDLFFRPGYHDTPLEVQQRSLRLMLELARAHKKPVVIHDRDAHAVVLEAIRDVPGSRGVMHCFTGDAEHAQRCADAGFLVSFSGIVTFRNAADIQDAARAVADDGFVVETDAPFLTPVPHRGSVNLPERVAVTADAVARLRDAPPDRIREATTANARRLFNLSDQADAVGS